MFAAEGEAARLRALEMCRVLDTPPEREFDRLVFTASQMLRTPIVKIALMNGTRAWFKARVGISLSEVQRSVSFTEAVVESGAPTVIEDVAGSERYWRNPLVRRESRVRFYAGAPVFGPSALPVGAFGVLDRQPRSLAPDQLRLLAALAGEVTGLLLRRVDPAARLVV